MSPSAPPLSSSLHEIISFPEFELLRAIGLACGDSASSSQGGGRKLGQGGFGTVYYCQLKINGTQTDAAVKVFSENVSLKIVEPNTNYYSTMIVEASLNEPTLSI